MIIFDALWTVIWFLISTVIVKGIVAHFIADKIVDFTKRWLGRQPHRTAYFNEVYEHYKMKSGTV